MAEKLIPPTTTVSRNDVAILTVSLDELRRFYDRMNHILDRVKTKALALIAGEIAVVSFLFSNDAPNTHLSDPDRLIFFWVGVGCLLISFLIFLYCIFSVPWKVPHDLDKSGVILAKNKTTLAFITYLHDDFIKSITTCLPKLIWRSRVCNWGIYLLTAGVIILMVIKFGAPK